MGMPRVHFDSLPNTPGIYRFQFRLPKPQPIQKVSAYGSKISDKIREYASDSKYKVGVFQKTTLGSDGLPMKPPTSDVKILYGPSFEQSFFDDPNAYAYFSVNDIGILHRNGMAHFVVFYVIVPEELSGNAGPVIVDLSKDAYAETTAAPTLQAGPSWRTIGIMAAGAATIALGAWAAGLIGLILVGLGLALLLAPEKTVQVLVSAMKGGKQIVQKGIELAKKGGSALASAPDYAKKMGLGFADMMRRMGEGFTGAATGFVQLALAGFLGFVAWKTILKPYMEEAKKPTKRKKRR